MSERREIIRLLEEILARREDALAAQVIAVEGSHYRRPGARMLLCRNGRRAGGISAGCLEADLERRFDEVAASGAACLLTYDLASESDLIFGTGLGCGGRIDVLAERLDPEQARILQVAFETAGRGTPCALVTLVGRDSKTLARAVWSVRGELIAGDAGLAAEPPTAETASTLTRRMLADGSILLAERFEPPPRVYVCGCGPDAVRLARTMSEIGWNIAVVSNRDPNQIGPLFEGCEARILDPERAACDIRESFFSAAVVMSHNFLDDLICVEALQGRPLAYLGIVGPRSRTERLLKSRRTNGNDATPAPVYAPAGLDLGGEGPAELALAIAAELTAVHHGAAALPMRGRTGKIHVNTRSR